jgi:hypothetical protein
MAPSHVPSEHLPLQGQSNIYSDPAYENLFPASHFVGAQPWNSTQLNHAGLAADNPSPQTWHHSPYAQQPFDQISQSYANQGHAHRTASPYQYGQFNNHGNVSNYGHAVNVDPSLGVDPNAMRQQQQSPYQMSVQNAPSQTQTSTVAPQALQQGLPVQNPRPAASSYQVSLQCRKMGIGPQLTSAPIPKTTAELFAQRAPPSYAKPIKNPEYELPKGRKSGGFVIFDQAAMAKATQSSALNKLVTFGSEPLHFTSNRSKQQCRLNASKLQCLTSVAALPLYTARQSVKELRKAGAGNKKSLAKKTSTKFLSTGKTLKQDVSDSESYDDSSDDDSEYSDDEDAEPSPLPATRPDEMHGATRYDIIKAAWFPRKSQLSSEKIKASLRDVWEIFNTIQKRWRIDSKAVTEAEEQKKTKELPVLKSRVTSSRDLLQSALQAALEHAHPDVLYHVGQVKPFLYLCYQFLANRFKMQDYDGGLSAAIYAMLARCVGTLTTELLEETKVIKALNSMKKNVNDQNKALIQQIVEGAAAGSKKAKVSSPPEEITVEPKVAKRPATQPLARSSSETSAAKKLKPTEPQTNGDKKPAIKLSSTTVVPLQKRPGDKSVPAPAPAKPRGTQVVNKPSTLFASLNAATKKPATSSTPALASKSVAKTATTNKDNKLTTAPVAKPAANTFAQTMAALMNPKPKETVAPVKSEKSLPAESPAEKAKRLRKESRRHLRVTFKPDASLVDIKYFHHDIEEESGHDENFVRDAGDIGGEGRMFKQHKENMGDDEDDDDEETEGASGPWREPSLVDFSRVDPFDRGRNYEPYGGGVNKPLCPDKEASVKREASTLMVYYSHPSDIPSSPREPLEQQTQPSPDAVVTMLGTPPQHILDRAPTAPVSASIPDISSLEALVKQLSAAQSGPPQPAANPTPMTYAQPPVAPAAAPVPIPAPALDLQTIMAQLQSQAPGPAPMSFPAGQQTGALYQGPAQAPVPMPFVPAQQTGAPAVDITALLASLAPAGNPAFAPPPPPGWPAFPPQQPNNAAAYQEQSYSQPQQDQYTRGGHKRQREAGNDNDNGKGHGSNKKNKLHGNHKLPHKVIPCRFFQKGLCNKGEDCTYIHDSNF